MERYIRELESPGGSGRRNRRFVLVLVAAFVLLVGIAAYGVVQNQRAMQARAYAVRNLAIRDAILRLEHWSTLMEIRHRGFLLSGDPSALPLREHADVAAEAAGRQLSALVAGDPAQGRVVDDVLAALRARHAHMVEVTRVAAAQGLDAARAAFAVRGAGSIDPVLSGLLALNDQQQAQLARVEARELREFAHFRTVLVVGATLALLAILLTSGLMLRQLSRNERLGREMVRLHRAQAEKGAELERSNRELEAFTYTVSHDLRAPLRHIDGYARMLVEDAGDALGAEPRRYLDAISESSRRMGALIDDLLAYSRLGRKPVERLPLEMNAFIGHVLPEAGAASSSARIEVGPLPPVVADPVLMRQAWVNLVSNALKYSAPKGAAARIEISGERDGATVRYTIRDNGVGFDMRYADKLFGVFQRMHSQDEFEGTGVGLAIVQQVVQRHGGRVRAEAAPGEGACFTIELPAETA